MSILPASTALPALTRADRCDRCSARALVRVLFPAGELLFCGHHARAHEERLLEIGATLTFAADR
jgi:hypothetical protein